METCNDTKLKLAWLPGMLQSPQHSLTLVVKGSFDLVAQGKAVFSEDPDAAAILGDVFLDDKPDASLRYANDLVIYKPKTDLTLTGVAYPQPGEAGCKVTFGVGNWQKSLAIFNQRFWRWGNATAPEPFGADIPNVPLTYENAFGGEHYASNPVGKGVDKLLSEQGEQLQPLPNIEHIDNYLSSPGQKSQPAGFGPLKDGWADKTEVKGTYGNKWLKENFPYFPSDFDWGYFNTAPQDQQVSFLTGDESLFFENLRPELSQLTSQLPAILPRLFLNGELDGQSFFQEVTLRLDTLHVDMEKQRVNLVWRGVVGVQSDEYEELSHACLFVENLSDSRTAKEVYFDALQASLAEDGSEYALEPFIGDNDEDVDIPSPKQKIQAEMSEGLDDESDMEAMFAKQFDIVKQQLADAGLPTELVDTVKAGMDPEAFMRAMAKTYNLDLAEGATLLAKSQQELKELFVANGFATELLETENPFSVPEDLPQDPIKSSDGVDLKAVPSVPAKPTEDELASGDLGGMDLSHRDLSDRDFKEANFAGANLEGANISGSNFESADLSKANLSEVNAESAIFDNAIMTGVEGNNANFLKASMVETVFQQAKLVKANFSEAILTSADFSQSILAGTLFVDTMMHETQFEQADLSQCRFEQVTCTLTNFSQANLRECYCEKSNLREAQFPQARLSLAHFEYSDLSEAVLESVNAKGIEFIECMMIKMRAGERSDFCGAVFDGGNALGIIFSDSNLGEAKFIDILLQGADFSQSDLSRAKFSHCDMKTAELAKANLTDCSLLGANLFQASFAKARLNRTDLGLTNLYGAEFHQASLQDTNLQGANFKQTKIELGLVK